MTGCGVHQILRPAPRAFQNRQRYGLYNKEAQHHHRIDNINEILLQIQSADKRNVFLQKTDQPCQQHINVIQKKKYKNAVDQRDRRHKELFCSFCTIQVQPHCRNAQKNEGSCAEQNFQYIYYLRHQSPSLSSSYMSSRRIVRPAINLYGARTISPAVFRGISVLL